MTNKSHLYKPTAIILDTKGPEIRTGLLQNGKKIQLFKKQILKISSDPSYLGNKKMITLSYNKLYKNAKKGDKILIADGNLILEILSVDL